MLVVPQADRGPVCGGRLHGDHARLLPRHLEGEGGYLAEGVGSLFGPPKFLKRLLALKLGHLILTRGLFG